ncbi:hydrolase [Pycnococcus provasolii]
MASTTSLGVTLTVLLAVITPSAVLPLYHHRHHHHHDGAPAVGVVEAQPLPVSSYSNGKGEPKYTSSPLPEALKAMPYACDDDCVSKLRFKAWEMQGNCTTCAFAWPATTTMANATTSDIMGIVLYNGAFVDPRSYSVLASKLASRGVNVIVPVFPNDLATDCNGMTLEAVTNAFFPNVTAWMVAGHSYGGVGASYAVAATLLCGTSPRVVALGVIGSYITKMPQCPVPVPNFEEDDHLHAAVITGNRDLSINLTNFVDNLNRLPVHTTFTSIIGGNHQQFGSYDPSGRSRLRDRPLIDGNATISRDAQLNATADALVRTLLRATKNNDISPRSLVDC